MSQLTYSDSQPIGIEGQIADSSVRDVVSKATEVEIAAGRFVVQGTAEDQAKLPTAAGDITGGKGLGVALYDASKEPGPYAIKDSVPIGRRGRYLVKVEEAVNPGDPVYVRHASGAGGTLLGSFRKSADTATAALLAGAVYRSVAAIAGLAIVELNQP